MRAAAALLVLAAALAGCGGGSGGGARSTKASGPADPGAAAVRVMNLILANRYAKAWRDLHPVDKQVAPRAEYVSCETRSPIVASATSVSALSVTHESVGLGNGHFVPSSAVRVRIVFPDGKVVHTVHLVASGGRWTWILPSWRFRDYRADRCPGTAPTA